MFSRVRGHSFVVYLIVACVIVFFIDGFTGRATGRPVGFMIVWGLLSDWGNFNADQAVRGFQVWRFLSFQFLHAGLLHLLFNMLILFYLGRFIESYLGSKRFLAFYLLCGVGGALLYLVLWAGGALAGNPNIPFLLNHGPDTPLVGASSGIFGILIGAALVAPDQRIQLWFPPIVVTLRVVAWVLIGIAVFGLMVGGGNAGGEAAHVGGVLVGWLLIRNPNWLNWADRMSPASIQAGYTQGRYEKLRRKQAQHEAEVDRILAKVREKGLQSLSRKEKKTLAEATERQRRNAG